MECESKNALSAKKIIASKSQNFVVINLLSYYHLHALQFLI